MTYTQPQKEKNHFTLRASSLSCTRGEKLLFNDLSFEVKPSECLHVIGNNGSGKSSLLRIICGLLMPNKGEVSADSQNTLNNNEYRSNLAYLGHKDAQKNELTSFENLAFYQRLDAQYDEDRIDQTLHQLGILHCADLTAQNLSFGQRRRLSFARLLLNYFHLWILDEPFTGIDHQGRELIENLCLDHLNNDGMIILTNHQSLADSSLKNHLKELLL